MTKNEKPNKPIKKFKAGFIALNIWKSKDDTSNMHTVTVDKIYKDKEGNWKSSGSFLAQDLPTISMLSEMAFKYMSEKK